jgi:AraC family transcriptional regulator
LHPAGQSHANQIHDSGLDCLSIRFDPHWLSSFGFSFKLERSKIWQGGEIPLRGRQLFKHWARKDVPESALAGATASFIEFAINRPPVRQPPWMERVLEAVGDPEPRFTSVLARELGLHPAWLARSYRQRSGEGLASTKCRLRLEAAAALLRESDEPLSQIAVATGFCDQSHMARVCLSLTGKTPLQLRTEVRALTSDASNGGITHGPAEG